MMVWLKKIADFRLTSGGMHGQARPCLGDSHLPWLSPRAAFIK
jgi:hypothetical protein